MRNLVRCVFAFASVVVGLAGCGSSGSKTSLTPSCIHNSDCTNNLVCIDRFCVSECMTSSDCTGGARCIIATIGNTMSNSCQPPELKSCAFNSDCTPGLVCGADSQCRNQCHTDVDCPKGQKCTTDSLQCADPVNDKDYDSNTNEFKPVDGGTSNGTGGSSSDGGPDGSAPDGGGTGGNNGDAAPSSDSAPDGMGNTDAPTNIDGPGTVLDGVMVSPSASVRPGQGNILITITQASGGLSNPSLFDFGGLSVHAQGGGTDTMLVLNASVPHGATMGKRTLKFASSGGVFMATDVVEVTAITVSPTGVDTNAGSAGSPFKTLKAAVLTAGSGDTIHVMDGTYNISSGEMWGYAYPDNITLVGDSTENTVLDGAGSTGYVNGIDASTKMTIMNMTFQHFYYGVDIKKASSTITMQDVYLYSDASAAVYVEQTAMGSTVAFTGTKGLITQPGQTAISVAAAGATVNVTDAKVQGGSYVINYSGNCSGSKLNVSNGTIEQLSQNSYQALYVYVNGNADGTAMTLDKATIIGGLYFADAKGSLTLTDGGITQKYGNGIDFSGKTLSVTGTAIMMTNNASGINYHSMQGAMTLKNVTIDGGNYGVYQTALGSTAKLRGTTIQNTQSHGYYLYQGDLDLGTMTESGDNVFGLPLNLGNYCLYITRGSGMNAGMPVTCSGTAFGGVNGQRPAPSDSVDAASAPVMSNTPQLYYVTTGDKLTFYDVM